jgi:hypothetical protein
MVGYASVLTHKDARSWIRVSEKTSSRQFMNKGNPLTLRQVVLKKGKRKDPNSS